MLVDLDSDQRGKWASPPATLMKTWSPTAQIARRAQFAKPYGYRELMYDCLEEVVDYHLP